MLVDVVGGVCSDFGVSTTRKTLGWRGAGEFEVRELVPGVSGLDSGPPEEVAGGATLCTGVELETGSRIFSNVERSSFKGFDFP